MNRIGREKVKEKTIKIIALELGINENESEVKLESKIKDFKWVFRGVELLEISYIFKNGIVALHRNLTSKIVG